jgi:hypothetical protein
MRLRQQFVLPGRIEGLLGLVDQGIDLGIPVAAPVHADRRDLAGVEKPATNCAAKQLIERMVLAIGTAVA